MIPIGQIGLKELPISVANILNTIANKSVDGSVDKVLKHKLANTADSTALASSAAEQNFSTNYTLSISMMFPGRIFKIIATGVYSTTGTPTLLFRVKFGTTNLVIFTARTGINNASNQSWMIEALIAVRSTGASGSVMASGKASINTSAGIDTVESVVNNAATTVDTTANQTLQISAQWSAASASNTTTLKNMIVLLSDY